MSFTIDPCYDYFGTLKIKFPEPSTINPKLVRGKSKYAQRGSMVFEFRALGFCKGFRVYVGYGLYY